MKHAILAVGTGRCGTSAMAGTLRILGAYLGEDLKPADAVNAKGYFENVLITDQNKATIAEAGMSWYGSAPELIHAMPVTATLCSMIKERVANIFAERSPILIKDPRLCVLLDAYVTALRGMGYELHAVRMLRDPTKVARSMMAATGAEASRWLPIVRRHAELLDAALKRTGIDCIDCTFDELLTSPTATVARVVARLPFLACSPARSQEILGFIDRSLEHHR